MNIFLLILSWISTSFRNEWHDNYSSVRRNLQSSRWLFTNFLRLRSRTPLYRWPVHMYHRCWRRWYIDLSANFKNLLKNKKNSKWICHIYSYLQEHAWMLMIATEDAIVLNVIIALMDAVDAHTFFKHCIHNKFTQATYIVTFFFQSLFVYPNLSNYMYLKEQK